MRSLLLQIAPLVLAVATIGAAQDSHFSPKGEGRIIQLAAKVVF
jgi:hypothetical protein